MYESTNTELWQIAHHVLQSQAKSANNRHSINISGGGFPTLYLSAVSVDDCARSFPMIIEQNWFQYGSTIRPPVSWMVGHLVHQISFSIRGEARKMFPRLWFHFYVFSESEPALSNNFTACLGWGRKKIYRLLYCFTVSLIKPKLFFIQSALERLTSQWPLCFYACLSSKCHFHLS